MSNILYHTIFFAMESNTMTKLKFGPSIHALFAKNFAEVSGGSKLTLDKSGVETYLTDALNDVGLKSFKYPVMATTLKEKIIRDAAEAAYDNQGWIAP